MNHDKYDPEEDPVYLQRKSIEILDSVASNLKEINNFQERQLDEHDSIKRTLNAINGEHHVRCRCAYYYRYNYGV